MKAVNTREYSRSRKGFVLVSVLMLGTMLISCATAFTWFARNQARSAGRETVAVTHRSMAQVMSGAVMTLLSEISQNTDADSPIQEWYKPAVLAVPEMGIWTVRITPLDDKIPLRNIFLPDGNTVRREFSEAWREMWNKIGERERADRVLDFMDKNAKPRVSGVEREYFLNRPPYDISELLIMSRDITSEILYGSGGKLGIADYCTVYSEGKINVNVAPVHVLELIPGLDTGGAAQSIADYREEHVIESLADLQKIPGVGVRTGNQIMNAVCFKSRYFSVKMDCMSLEGDNILSYSVIFDRTSKQTVRWEEQ